MNYNIMLLGDSGVGKTCLLVRFKEGSFLGGNFMTTVGIDFRSKTIEVNNEKVKLQIWDTAGQERYRSITHAYYRDAHALLLLYDLSCKTSFDSIRAWLTEIKQYASPDVVILLLANKYDIPNSLRKISKDDGTQIAKENNVHFMEVSAKTGHNVNEAFTFVAKCLLSRNKESSRNKTSSYNSTFNKGQLSLESPMTHNKKLYDKYNSSYYIRCCSR